MKCFECHTLQTEILDQCKAFELLANYNRDLNVDILIDNIQRIIKSTDPQPSNLVSLPSNVTSRSEVKSSQEVTQSLKCDPTNDTEEGKVTPEYKPNLADLVKTRRRLSKMNYGSADSSSQGSRVNTPGTSQSSRSQATCQMPDKKSSHETNLSKKKREKSKETIVRNPFPNFDLKRALKAHVELRRLSPAEIQSYESTQSQNEPELSEHRPEMERKASSSTEFKFERTTREQLNTQIRDLASSVDQEGEMERQCKICDKIFKGAKLANIYRHVRQAHFSERRRNCQNCGQIFYSPFTLARHPCSIGNFN